MPTPTPLFHAVLALLVACGQSAQPESAEPSREPVEMAPTPDDSTPVEPEPAEQPQAEATPVDLLRSVRTDLAVSSVYRDQAIQTARLVDGDLETAWNSRTGELAGAWIEARIPASATVTSIALTAGFTKVNDGTDLFTGNHRVSRIRVLRDGTEVGSFALNVESRELQSFDLRGPGGVYRIEVAEVVAGSRSSWREICISELRIFGTDPGAREGARLPQFGVGALPAPRPAPGSHDRAEVAARLREEAQWLARAWKQFERDLQSLDWNTGEPEGSPEERAALARTRRTILSRASDFVELVDDVQADGLRAAAATEIDWSRWQDRAAATRADVDRIAAAFAAVVAWLGDEPSRCEWARADVALRLARISIKLATRSNLNEVSESMDFEGLTREDVREFRRVERGANQFASVERSWGSRPAETAPRIRALDFPDVPDLVADWDAIRAHLDGSPASCGWPAAAPTP
jgi:hypothetical protein